MLLLRVVCICAFRDVGLQRNEENRIAASTKTEHQLRAKNAIQFEEQNSDDSVRRIEKLRSISTGALGGRTARSGHRRQSKHAQGHDSSSRDGESLQTVGTISKVEGADDPLTNDISSSSSAPRMMMRRRTLQNASALRKMAEMKRMVKSMSHEQVKKKGSHSTGPESDEREQRKTEDSLSFADRVAREERLLSARKDKYRECTIMDEDENDRRPHGKMCWKVR